MKIDLYTKIVLTVIASCLTLSLIKSYKTSDTQKTHYTQEERDALIQHMSEVTEDIEKTSKGIDTAWYLISKLSEKNPFTLTADIPFISLIIQQNKLLISQNNLIIDTLTKIQASMPIIPYSKEGERNKTQEPEQKKE